MSDKTEWVVEEGKPVYNIRHRAFYFAKDVIVFIANVKYERIHFSIFDQLLRSATSVGANLVEGKAGVSEKDFINYNSIALKSSNETKYWLSLIKEANLAEKTKVDEMIKEMDEISKIIATIIINTKKKE
jgi:four helix bundle protein